MAIELMKDETPSGATCGMILPDRGERYLGTIYSEEWVTKHFGNVTHLLGPYQDKQSSLTVTN